MGSIDPDSASYPFQLTKSMHRSMYPALDPSRPELSAEGKNVIITGASGGIGQAMAEAWCIAKAASVLITGRNVVALNEVAEKIRAISPSTKVIVQPADLLSEDSIKELYQKAYDELGTVHVLINNAGNLTWAVTGEVEPSQWWKDYEINVKGPYMMSHYFMEQGDRKGTIINVSTIAVHMGITHWSSYATSKLAQQKLAELMQLEHPELRIFSLLPGIVKTAMLVKDYEPYALDDAMLSGGLSLYLASPRADYLKGHPVSINWDVEEMEAHKDEIIREKLLDMTYMNAKLGKDGHPWEILT